MYASNSITATTRKKGPVIAIDGPAGAGKSTVAKAIAEMFGLAYVSTGLIYRALTLKAICLGADIREAECIGELARSADVAVLPEDGDCRILLDGEDVTAELTSPEVCAYVSQVAEIPDVRAALLDIQRAIAKKGSVVMDGRDIGTVVAPDADVKIFLVADFEERVRRRVLQARERGYDVVEETVVSEIKNRDTIDSGRKVAPLKPAPDAITVDTTGKTPEETIAEVAGIIRKELCGNEVRNTSEGMGEKSCFT
ncbi:MAG: (d)CMP kinase [Bacillota bacterium]|jgi:cytidylate kinase|nr:(d)CMP kinase [Bacillota bacterium]MDI9415319.1 (d)CMP kinase [Bacillota bacterium]NLD12842.1 (d)CMP kinase [Bacillota bacterium]HOB88056.1 (d)CMP kinase [Bacillota bacterium]HOJ57066.1 (d)CMP kinase [Bacillota bacterium]